MLFPVSEADRRTEIETGLGIEPILPDTQVKQILDTQILPKFKENLFDRGTIAGTTAIIDVLENYTNSGQPLSSEAEGIKLHPLLLIIMVLLFNPITLFLLSLAVFVLIYLLFTLFVFRVSSILPKRYKSNTRDSDYINGGSSASGGSGDSGGASDGGGSGGDF